MSFPTADLLQLFEHDFVPLLERCPRFRSRLSETTERQHHADIYELDGNYVFEMDLPGVTRDNITVDVTNLTESRQQLTVSSNRTNEREDQQTHLSERFFGSVSRTVTLPGLVNVSAVSARYENGVLSVTLPKAEDDTEMRTTITVE